MFKQKIIPLVIIYLFLNGCAGIKNNNGYMPVQDSIEKLKVNSTSLSSAKSKLGEPALILGNQEPIFIYSSQVTDRVLFFEPKVISRNVLVLYFSKKKKLKKVDQFNLADGMTFDLNTNSTELNAGQKSTLASIFSNVGVGGVRIPD